MVRITGKTPDAEAVTVDDFRPVAIFGEDSVVGGEKPASDSLGTKAASIGQCCCNSRDLTADQTRLRRHAVTVAKPGSEYRENDKDQEGQDHDPTARGGGLLVEGHQ